MATVKMTIRMNCQTLRSVYKRRFRLSIMLPMKSPSLTCAQTK